MLKSGFEWQSRMVYVPRLAQEEFCRGQREAPFMVYPVGKDGTVCKFVRDRIADFVMVPMALPSPKAKKRSMGMRFKKKTAVEDEA